MQSIVQLFLIYFQGRFNLGSALPVALMGTGAVCHHTNAHALTLQRAPISRNLRRMPFLVGSIFLFGVVIVVAQAAVVRPMVARFGEYQATMIGVLATVVYVGAFGLLWAPWFGPGPFDANAITCDGIICDTIVCDAMQWNVTRFGAFTFHSLC